MDVLDTNFYQPTPKEQQVWKVCDSLLTESKRITYQSIGERLLSLGLKRGSNTDICRYLASWKKHHYPTIMAKKGKVASPPSAPKSTAPSEQLGVLNQYLKSFHQSLQTISLNQQSLLDALSDKNQQATSIDSNKDVGNIIPLLTDLIQKQQQRETHYLKALEHAREIQQVLKRELQKYHRQAEPLKVDLTEES